MNESLIPALSIRGLRKSFGGVKALQDVDVEVRQGQVLGLLGQNGSGKSTMVKILTSVYTPDAGEVLVFGDRVVLPAKDPKKTGIAVVHQDVGLEDSMTVFENVEASINFGTLPLFPIRPTHERQKLLRLQQEVGIDLDLDAKVASLSPAKRTFVGILRAMRLLDVAAGRRILIMDEPTSSLSAADARQVTSLLRRVADSGAGVMFISHRLGEVLDVCDAVTVLKDGTVTLSQPTGDLSQSDLTQAMLGRRMESFYPPRPSHVTSKAALVVSNVSSRGELRDVSFTAHRGEIVGFTGLTGMGHEELPALLSGQVVPTSGSVTLADGEELKSNAAGAIRQGVVMVPGNRARDGGWLGATATENITLPVLKELSVRGVLRPRAERQRAQPLMDSLSVRPNDPDKILGLFSGGNQQKVVMAKWLQTKPDVLVLDEPTQGVDAGAKHEILELIVGVADQGGSVIMVSGDHEQLAHVCNRVFILNAGRIVDVQSGPEMSEESLIAACNSANANPSGSD